MIAAIIVVPNLILAGLLAIFLPTEYYWALIIPLSIGVGGFITRNGINEWWYSKYPPRLSAVETKILSDFFPYYHHLNPELKAEFERRVAVFRMQKLFQMRALEKVPGDVQLLVCASAIQLTMGFPYQREFYKKLSTIVLYPKTFITPDINENLHALELKEDKPYDCLLLSINVFIDSLKRPHSFYNIGLYGFAKSMRLSEPEKAAAIPGDYKENLAKLHVLRGFDIGYIFSFIGKPEFELFELLVEHFFCYPAQIQQEMPAVYAYLMDFFKQDPCNRSNPVIQTFS